MSIWTGICIQLSCSWQFFYCCRFNLCACIWGANGPFEGCYSWCTWHSIPRWTLCFRPVPTSWVSPYTSCMAIILPLQVEMCSYNVSQNCKGVLLLYIGSLLVWQIDLMKHITIYVLISCCMEYGIPCLHSVCNMRYVGVNVQNCSKPIITLEGWDWIQISMRVEKCVLVCWTHGQAGAQRCGTPQLRVFSKCLYLYKAWC